MTQSRTRTAAKRGAGGDHPHERKHPRRRLERQLLAYAAAAGVGATLGAADADAIPIYFDIPDELISNGSFDLDVDDDGTVDFTISHSVVGGEFYLDIQGQAPNNGAVGYSAFSYYAWALGAGEQVGPGATFVPDPPYGNSYPVLLGYRYGSYTYGPWTWSSEDQYLGFRFDVPGMGAHYGWARLSVDPNNLHATLKDYAYESAPGEAITTGATPEPNSLALLALGMTGLVAWRRGRARS